jgi:hypothetical protein
MKGEKSMRDKSNLISYILAAMAGICFVRGLVILSSEGVK